MKGKQMTIRALQDEINSALEKYAGNKYNDNDHIKWFRNEVLCILDKHNIKEMHPYAWEIVLDASEQGVSLSTGDRIAKLSADLNRDKRVKYGPGRGKVNSLTVSFREDILDMTLDQARKFLFEERRDECIKRLQDICMEARKQFDEANAAIVELAAAQF